MVRTLQLHLYAPGSRAAPTMAPLAHVGGVSNEATAMWAALFFWARLAHAVIYILGIPFLRTIIFTVGFVAVVGIFYEIVM